VDQLKRPKGAATGGKPAEETETSIWLEAPEDPALCIGQVTPSGTYLLQTGSTTRSYRKQGTIFATHWLTVKDKGGQHVATLKLSRNNATTENGEAAATAEEGDEGLFTSWRTAPKGPEQLTRRLSGGGLFCSETDAIRYNRGTEKLSGDGPSRSGKASGNQSPGDHMRNDHRPEQGHPDEEEPTIYALTTSMIAEDATGGGRDREKKASFSHEPHDIVTGNMPSAHEAHEPSDETEDKKRPNEQQTPEGKERAAGSDDKKRKSQKEYAKFLKGSTESEESESEKKKKRV
jgi:hypothetical protein